MEHETDLEKPNKFSGGVMLDVLQQIDDLPEELGLEVRKTITAGGKYGSILEKKRLKVHDELIELGYLKDLTVGEEILNKRYSKDNLIVELSKKQYDFEVKSSTTKREMIEYILSNEKAKKKLVKKYISVTSSDELKECIEKYKLWDFLEELYIAHPYMTTDVKLVDFYYEKEEKSKAEEKSLDDLAKSIVYGNKTEKKDEKKSFFSRFFKK